MRSNRWCRAATWALVLAAIAADGSSALAPGQALYDCFFSLPGRDIRGLTYDGGVLWITHAPAGNSDRTVIAKLDAQTWAVLAQSAELTAYNARGVCVGEGSLWLADAHQDRVHRVDPVTLQETGSFPTPGSEPCGIAFDGSSLWLTDPWAQRVYQMTTAGAVVSSFPIPDLWRTGLEWDPACGGLWTLTGRDQASHYTTAGTHCCPINYAALAGDDRVIDLAIGGGKTYLSSKSKIYRVDTAPGCETPLCPAIALAGREVHGVAYESGFLWVTHSWSGDADYHVISKIDLATFLIVAQSPVRHYNARGISAGPCGLWITDALADRVRQLDPVDFHEIQSCATPGSEPCGITCDGASLWLTDPYAQRTYQLSTSCQIVSSFPIPDLWRRGLAWDPARNMLWMPTAEHKFALYSTTGTLVANYEVLCLPFDVAAFDLALSGDDWFVSGEESIYLVVPWSDKSVAIQPASWSSVKSLYKP